MNRVSVILAVYNGERYIEKAIRSVLKQSYKNLELIIVDDGSTDGSKDIIKKFNDNRISYIYQDNQGPAKARNVGIEKAIGEYIAFIDSDDMYLIDKIEKQVNELEKDLTVDIIYNNALAIDEEDRILNELIVDIELRNKNDFYAYCFFRQVIPCLPSIIVRKKCFKDIKYPENYINAEDYLLTLKLAKKYKYKYINEYLYLYRRHENNLTNNHKKQLENEREIVNLFYKSEVINAINSSTFSEEEKKMLLGKILLKIEKYKDAQEIFQEIKEKNDIIYFYIGNCLFYRKLFDLAEEFFLKAIEINSTKAEYFNNLGVIYKLKNNETKGKKCFENAITLTSEYLDPIKNLEDNENIYFTNKELRKTLSNYK